jgi:hypothetical protein
MEENISTLSLNKPETLVCQLFDFALRHGILLKRKRTKLEIVLAVKTKNSQHSTEALIANNSDGTNTSSANTTKATKACRNGLPQKIGASLIGWDGMTHTKV